jgi:tetratricopeptide (TPR) repeat protein
MSILKKISRASVYLLLFLIPLFFLPFTQNVLEFQKQTLLLTVASFGLLSWLCDALISKKFIFNFNRASLLVAAALLATLISAFFSMYSYGSLWGLPLDVAASFLTVTGFALFYFLVINLFSREEISKLLFTLVLSGFLAALIGIFQICGLFLFPFEFAKFTSFNTVGTANGLALFLSAVLVISLSLLFGEKKPLKMVFLGLFALVLFFALVLINFFAAWIVLAVGAITVFIQTFVDKESSGRGGAAMIFSFALLFVSLVFICASLFAKDFVSDVYKNLPQTPAEVSLSQKTTLDMSFSTLKASAKNLFLGSGPGTFVYDYSRYKPESINLTDFWSMRFYAGSSDMLDRLMAVGLIGIIVYFLLIAFVAYKGFRVLGEGSEYTDTVLAVYASWLAVVAAQFFYPFNLTLAFLFWALTAFIVAYDDDRKEVVELSLGSKVIYAAPMLMVVFLAFQLGILTWLGKRYYAEVKYVQAMNELQAQNYAGAAQSLAMAKNSTASAQDNYLRDLSQVYLVQAQAEIAKSENQEEALKKTAPLLAQAVELSKANTDAVNGNDVDNWAVRGFIYRQLFGVMPESDTWAVTSYKKAIELDPSNPYLYTELAQAYINAKNLAAAEESLTKAVALNPNYSNARYFLGLIYDNQGKKDEAIAQFEVIAQLNPDNQDIKKILDNLKSGKPASGQPAPSLTDGAPAGNQTPIPAQEPSGSGSNPEADK